MRRAFELRCTVAELDRFYAECFPRQLDTMWVSRPKPAPDLLLHALTALEVEAARAWMVGDSRFDRDAARAAGIYFIGLGIDGDRRIEALAELGS